MYLFIFKKKNAPNLFFPKQPSWGAVFGARIPQTVANIRALVSSLPSTQGLVARTLLPADENTAAAAELEAAVDAGERQLEHVRAALALLVARHRGVVDTSSSAAP